ncbi:MAG TPA: M23 family metallopeptidase [Gemmatimonadota bacterium]|nr:M23 family metallopeptidase [Gemmatimonadota bacterium]
MSEKYLTLLMVPHDERGVRRLRLSYRGLRTAGISLLAVGLLAGAAILAYGRLTARAIRTDLLELENARLAAENEKIHELQANLERTEEAYRQIRLLAGLSMPEIPRKGTEETGIAVGSAAAPRVDPTASAARIEPIASAPGPRPASGTDPSGWPLSIRGTVHARFTGIDGHPGIDIAAPAGTAVQATGSGTVKQTGYDQALGHFVVLSHGGGTETMYAHNARVRVERGEAVERGETIASSGSSGRSDIPHLHYEVRRGGLPIDPAPYLP